MSIVSLKDKVSPEEWAVRVQLASAYRAAFEMGYELSIFGHISARVPGEPDALLLNPFGLAFDEITASSLVKVDKNRKILTENGYELNQAGFNLHSGIMFTSPHVNAIIHAHTLDGAAVGAMKGGFQPLTQDGAMVYPKVRYLDYDGIVVLPGEGEASAKALGRDGRVLILKNHGTLSVGATMGEAFFYFYFFEKACSIQVRALSNPAGVQPISEKIMSEMPAEEQVVLKGLTKLADAHEKTPYDDIFAGFMRRAKRRYADVDS